MSHSLFCHRNTRPKIQGTVLRQPNPDPLVVGVTALPTVREVGITGPLEIETGRGWTVTEVPTAFLIGAFDESRFERWVRSEMTQTA